MVEVSFLCSKDAQALHIYLQKKFSSSFLQHNLLQKEDQHIVRIKLNGNLNDITPIEEAFYQFIVEKKQEEWFRSILREQYYFQDEEEQQQIIDIITSIVEGKRNGMASFIRDVMLEEHMRKAVREMFQENIAFSFDSFIKFRMRSHMEELEKLVSLSIDEYKMEQEYQVFIQTLRDFLYRQEKVYETIVLFINEEDVRFYDSVFVEFKRSELTKMIDRKLLINHPVYVDSVTIAPLLSVAPSHIYLYTNDKEQPLVRTLHNIFEERIHFGTLHDFERDKQKCSVTVH